jgi:fructosamine-3-kinase
LRLIDVRHVPTTGPRLLNEVPPHSVWVRVVEALRAAGDATPVRRLEPVRGGAESRAYKLATRQAAYFLKWSAKVKPGRYPAEARGLALLRETRSVRVPEVLAVEDVRGGEGADGARGEAERRTPGFFLMEWLDRPPTDVYLRRVGAGLGTQVAALHRCDTFWGTTPPGYRRDDGVLGPHVPPEAGTVRPQHGAGALGGGGLRADGWEPDWVTFFREQCLRPLVERAAEQGHLAPEGRRRLERLMDRLDTWLGGVERRPSLLHGDLHRGNVLCDRAGAPALVDPIPSFGDREVELTHLEMSTYGRFPPVFYAAYFEAWPAAPGREERRDLYVIAHLLGALARGDHLRAMALDALVYRYVGA